MLTGLSSIFFYFFSGIMLGAACLLVCSRNPVHSALCLVAVFFNASGLFLLAGAEFLAMTLLIVYAGAVAILFLFVVMMIDVDWAQENPSKRKKSPFTFLIGAILVFELLIVASGYMPIHSLKGISSISSPVFSNNTGALGNILYTDYVYFFEIAGVILLVAMIGAIVLALDKKLGVRRQDISRQVSRSRETSIEIQKVKTGSGI